VPIILIALIGGLVVAAVAAVYFLRVPAAERAPTDGRPLIVLGLFFVTMSIVAAITDGATWYVWGPVGIVFLAVGLQQTRRSRNGERRS
jgi:hypothetical protein